MKQETLFKICHPFSMLLLPTPQAWENEPLIYTPERSYCAIDYEVLFQKSNFNHGFQRYQLLANLTSNMISPGVPVFHLYGIDVDTPSAFQYESNNDFDQEPKTINGNGDGTVPLRSLRIASTWLDNNNGKEFQEKAYPSRTHSGILKDEEYIKDVIQLLS